MNGTTSYSEFVARSYQVMAEDGWSFSWETGCMHKEGSPPVPVAPEDRRSAFVGCHWAKVEAKKEERRQQAEAQQLISRIPPLAAAWVAVGQERAMVSIAMTSTLNVFNEYDLDHLRWRVRMLVRAARHAAQMQLEHNRDLKVMMRTIEGYERWHYGPGQHGPASHTG